MSIEKEIGDMEEYHKLLTNYTMELKKRSSRKALETFCERRRFSVETADKLDIFYVGEQAEMLLPSYYDKVEELGIISPTNKQPIFNNRYVIPIKNEYGYVQNLVGYSGDSEQRYIYGTAKYYRRTDTLWGLENMHKAYEEGYAILTEGITDAIALRNIGFELAFANCGTHGSHTILKQLNRPRYGLIKIPDRDTAGERANEKWKVNRMVQLAVFIQYKDIDELIRKSDRGKEWATEYLNDCINWIKQKEHNGVPCECQHLTMY